MTIDPALLVAVGDVFLNLSAGWFGAAIIVPAAYPQESQVSKVYLITNLFCGTVALAIGYQFRILGI